MDCSQFYHKKFIVLDKNTAAFVFNEDLAMLEVTNIHVNYTLNINPVASDIGADRVDERERITHLKLPLYFLLELNEK